MFSFHMEMIPRIVFEFLGHRYPMVYNHQVLDLENEHTTKQIFQDQDKLQTII